MADVPLLPRSLDASWRCRVARCDRIGACRTYNCQRSIGAIWRNFTPGSIPERQSQTARLRWVQTIVLEKNLHVCTGVRFDDFDFPIEGLRVKHGRFLSRELHEEGSRTVELGLVSVRRRQRI